MYREENLTESYLKINPSGTIPALIDPASDVTVWDSHAISIYLVQKYAKDDSLYPRDFKKRTTVNERMFFEASFLFARLFEICVSEQLSQFQAPCDPEFLNYRTPSATVESPPYQPRRKPAFSGAMKASSDSSSTTTRTSLDRTSHWRTLVSGHPC